MKKLSAVLLSCALLASGAASAENIIDTAVSKSTVNYACQQGKKLRVTYGFNAENLPVYAAAHLNGKMRYMPKNLYVSDNVSTVFGDEDNFKLSSGYMDRKNHRRQAVMITSPGQEILFKSCMPRHR